MNIMRKLRSGSGGGGAPPSDDSSQHSALGVMHLKKLFAEFTHSVNHLNDKEKDDKLYNMLPLFCKVGTVDFFFLYIQDIYVRGVSVNLIKLGFRPTLPS